MVSIKVSMAEQFEVDSTPLLGSLSSARVKACASLAEFSVIADQVILGVLMVGRGRE